MWCRAGLRLGEATRALWFLVRKAWLRNAKTAVGGIGHDVCRLACVVLHRSQQAKKKARAKMAQAQERCSKVMKKKAGHEPAEALEAKGTGSAESRRWSQSEWPSASSSSARRLTAEEFSSTTCVYVRVSCSQEFLVLGRYETASRRILYRRGRSIARRRRKGERRHQLLMTG